MDNGQTSVPLDGPLSVIGEYSYLLQLPIVSPNPFASSRFYIFLVRISIYLSSARQFSLFWLD